MNNRIFLILILLILPSVSAAPTINDVTGSLVHDGTITVAGTGFGTSPIPEILAWEDFDSGTVGQAITTANTPAIGSWVFTNAGGDGPPVYSDDCYSGLCTFYGKSGGFRTNPAISLSSNKNKYYISYRFKFYVDGYNAGSSIGQIKIWQLWGSDSPTPDYDPGVMSGCEIYGWCNSYFVSEAGFNINNREDYSIPQLNQWNHIEGVLKQSTPSVSDGSVKIYLNNQAIYDKQNIVTRLSSQYYWDQIKTFYGFTNNNGYAENQLDDIYVASSWARIEIGNAPTYAASNKRQIQIPTAWSTNSISFDLNFDGFTQTEIDNGLYLYVIDENNVATTGKLLGEEGPVCNNNNILNIGEACDDGNFNENDGCNSQCQYAVPTNGQVHWVDENNPSCSDSGNGKTQPWCSIQAIESKSFIEGDSVVIRAGDYTEYTADTSCNEYFESAISISGSGSASNPIVIMGYPGESVTIRNKAGASYSPYWGCNVFGLGGSYKILQGLTIRGTITAANSQNLIIRNNTFIGITTPSHFGQNYAGIYPSGSRNLVVRNNFFTGYRGDGSGNNAGIEFYGYDIGRDNIVENNFFENNVGAIFDKSDSRNNIYRKNIMKNNEYGLKLCEQLDCYGLQTYQNLFINNYINNGGSMASSGISFFNNVFINSVMMIHFTSVASIKGTYYNNIHVGTNEVFDVNNNRVQSSDYNLFSNFNSVIVNYASLSFNQWKNFGYDTHSIIANPDFAETERYTLSPSSPAIDAAQDGVTDLGLYPDGDTSVVIGLAQPSGTPPPPICNNNNICEIGNGETILNCPNDCAVTQTCGNNDIEGTEVCDGSNLGGFNCTTIPGTYTGGTLSCNAQCTAFIESACTAPPQTEWIIDNGQEGTSSSAGWSIGTGFPGYYGTNYEYSDAAIRTYEWQKTLPEGIYEVSISWSYASTRPASNTYNIYHDSGIATFEIDQRNNDNGFYTLGEFAFTTTGRVELISGITTEGASADAVRFVRIGDIPNCTLEGYDLAPPCGTINIQDLTEIINYYGTSNTQYDFNNDGKINIIDLVTHIKNWN